MHTIFDYRGIASGFIYENIRDYPNLKLYKQQKSHLV